MKLKTQQNIDHEWYGHDIDHDHQGRNKCIYRWRPLSQSSRHPSPILKGMVTEIHRIPIWTVTSVFVGKDWGGEAFGVNAKSTYTSDDALLLACPQMQSISDYTL